MRLIIMDNAILFLFTLLLTGCYPSVPRHITPSFADARTLMTIDPSLLHSINVEQFTSSLKNHYALLCRPGRSIHAPFLMSFADELSSAIRNDLSSLNLYHPYSSQAYLQGNLDTLFFDAGGFGQGTWNMQVSFIGKTHSGTTPLRFTLRDTYHFTINQDSHDFCKQIADTFPAAVQQFLKKLYGTKQFQQILTQ